MITDKVVIGDQAVLNLTSSTTLEANECDIVIFSGSLATVTLPKTIESINGQYINFINKGTGGLLLTVQSLDIIESKNGSSLNYLLLPGDKVKVLANVSDIKWVVDTSASYIVTSTPNYLANRIVGTWTNRTSGVNNDNRYVCWSPQLGLFCAIGGSSGAQKAIISSNGVVWTAATSMTARIWLAVCWAPELNLFVAVSYDGATQQAATSPDGNTWTLQNTGTAANYCAIAWSPQLSRLVAVSELGSQAMYSSNGINWTTIAVPIADVRAICWAAELGLFVAVGQSDTRIMTSPDGINWTARVAPENNEWKGVCWSPEVGLLVAVAADGTNRVMTSPDGIIWTARAAAAVEQWFGVCWSPELGIYTAVAHTGTNQIMVSSNGVNWTLKASGTPTKNYRFICWSPELSIFCAVANGTNNVMTSAMNARLPTSYNTFDNVFNNISELGLWNFRSFGRNAPRNVTSSYSILPGDNWISVNSGTVTLTLPKAGDNPGLELMVKNISGANTTFSAAAGDTLVNATGGALTTIATGTWITLVSNGITSWVTTQL